MGGGSGVSAVYQIVEDVHDVKAEARIGFRIGERGIPDIGKHQGHQSSFIVSGGVVGALQGMQTDSHHHGIGNIRSHIQKSLLGNNLGSGGDTKKDERGSGSHAGLAIQNLKFVVLPLQKIPRQHLKMEFRIALGKFFLGDFVQGYQKLHLADADVQTGVIAEGPADIDDEKNLCPVAPAGNTAVIHELQIVFRYRKSIGKLQGITPGNDHGTESHKAVQSAGIHDCQNTGHRRTPIIQTRFGAYTGRSPACVRCPGDTASPGAADAGVCDVPGA